MVSKPNLQATKQDIFSNFGAIQLFFFRDVSYKKKNVVFVSLHSKKRKYQQTKQASKKASTKVEPKTDLGDMQPSKQPSKQAPKVETKDDMQLSKQPSNVYKPISFWFCRNPCNVPDYNVPMPKLVGPIEFQLGIHRFSVEACMD